MKKDEDLIKKLDAVIDPELNIPITEMGLIYGVEKIENDKIKVLMTLTTIGCPLYDVIHDDIVRVLKVDKNIKEVKIELTFDPPWSPEMMTDSAKMDIGFL
ncbi:MAG: metal-sulfur cluster assembly factor [Patescibacteria group bacterium]|nr:metal-sulfur cluster assembly factor [Patescibacteria group bacterium]